MAGEGQGLGLLESAQVQQAQESKMAQKVMVDDGVTHGMEERGGVGVWKDNDCPSGQ